MEIDVYFFLQWIAMGVTVGASWLMAASSQNRRNAGFWAFLASNALWIIWGWHDTAYALVTLQIALAAMNIRGVMKT
jgi:hypothetical protein